MHAITFLLASAIPAIFLLLRYRFLRGLDFAQRMSLDFLLLVISLPLGTELIGWLEDFPSNPGDHSPGLGVAFVILWPLWFVCLIVWFVRLIEPRFRRGR